MKSANVQVSVLNRVGGTQTSTTLTIHFRRPDSIRVDIREPAQGDFDASSRSYFANPNRAVGVDHTTKEYLVRTPMKSGTLPERLGALIGDFGEPTGMAVDGAIVRAVFARFKSMGKWKSSAHSKGTTFVCERESPPTRLSIDFARSGGLTKVDLRQGTNVSVWTYAYKPGSVPTLAIPANHRRVNQFTARPKPPSFADASAKSTFEAMVRAYDALQRYTLEVSGSNSYRFWCSGRDLRFESDSVLWILRPNGAVVFDKKARVYYSGKCSSGDFVGALGQLRFPAPWVPRQTLLRNNPVYSLVPGKFTVRSAGAVQYAGKNIQILEFESPLWTALVDVDAKSHLLAKVVLTNKDGAGRVVSRSSHQLAYRQIQLPIAPATFVFSAPKGVSKKDLKPFVD